jgi:hypothetical protein
MAKFLFVYRDQPDPAQGPPSPEQVQAIMAEWGVWFRKVGAAVVDGGDGLQPTGRMVRPGGKVSDGPFIEAKEVVGGYSVVQADTYEQAVEYAKSCPIVANGGTIEIRELAGFN